MRDFEKFLVITFVTIFVLSFLSMWSHLHYTDKINDLKQENQELRELVEMSDLLFCEYVRNMPVLYFEKQLTEEQTKTIYEAVRICTIEEGDEE